MTAGPVALRHAGAAALRPMPSHLWIGVADAILAALAEPARSESAGAGAGVSTPTADRLRVRLEGRT